MNSTDLTPSLVAARVAPYLEAISSDELRFTVGDPSAIVQGRGYWRVPVHPPCWTERMYAAAQGLSQVEVRIHEVEGICLLLMLREPCAQTA